MATYSEIQDYVRSKDGFTVKTCWIAHIKAEHGLTTRLAPNRFDPSRRHHPCPPDKRSPIESAMRHFRMI
ncbi:RNA methyltransferase [Edaphobacter bradus]|uniref:RNA methyltransferase n=1 Tax=Edaphobacter bradus TaxID=2259016 RepID=UPI0021DFD09D|nr:RNA methyltransferase [Edaphobacter bradus]